MADLSSRLLEAAHDPLTPDSMVPLLEEAARSARAPASGGVDAVAGLSRADICRLWQWAAVNKPSSMTVEGFTDLLLNEIDGRSDPAKVQSITSQYLDCLYFADNCLSSNGLFAQAKQLRGRIASLSPAATPVSEAGGEAEDDYAQRLRQRALLAMYYLVDIAAREPNKHIRSREFEAADQGAVDAITKLAALAKPASSPASTVAPLRRVRHARRGSEYEVLGEAEGQVSKPHIHGGVMLGEGDRVVVYRGTDGRLWWRVPDEFSDGRFVDI